jgi:hypothetical protein
MFVSKAGAGPSEETFRCSTLGKAPKLIGSIRKLRRQSSVVNADPGMVLIKDSNGQVLLICINLNGRPSFEINKNGKGYTKALLSYLFCLKDPRRNPLKI